MEEDSVTEPHLEEDIEKQEIIIRTEQTVSDPLPQSDLKSSSINGDIGDIGDDQEKTKRLFEPEIEQVRNSLDLESIIHSNVLEYQHDEQYLQEKIVTAIKDITQIVDSLIKETKEDRAYFEPSDFLAREVKIVALCGMFSILDADISILTCSLSSEQQNALNNQKMWFSLLFKRHTIQSVVQYRMTKDQGLNKK